MTAFNDWPVERLFSTFQSLLIFEGAAIFSASFLKNVYKYSNVATIVRKYSLKPFFFFKEMYITTKHA